LPATFRGYSTNFSAPDAAGRGVRRMEPAAPDDPPVIHHHIVIMTLDEFLRWELGIDSVDHLSVGDWLTFPEQKLLEVTAGAVYHDGLGQLAAVRDQLEYYPHDVWLYKLAAQWRRIAEEEAYVGRSGDVGDELGSQLIAARLVYDVMRLCFLLERRYVPWTKWWGTAFGRLACARDVGPQLRAVLAATTWQEREERLAHVYETVARMQNALALSDPQDPSSRPQRGRPYRGIMANRFVVALRAAIQDPEVRRIAENFGLAGALDQWADSLDILYSPATVRRRVGRVFDVTQ
jgi:hypothetical protein